ncbi:MAG: helix-turn-helix domain-containing protein [Planctomycetia bacterium]|nr:helix-turn-helix domain-containing protein [Planctomycetia bacterium]
MKLIGMQRICIPVALVASTLCVSPKTVYRLIRLNRLKHLRVGRTIRVPMSEVMAFMEAEQAKNWSAHGSVVPQPVPAVVPQVVETEAPPGLKGMRFKC